MCLSNDNTAPFTTNLRRRKDKWQYLTPGLIRGYLVYFLFQMYFLKSIGSRGCNFFWGGERIISQSTQELFSICSSPRFMHHLTYIHHTHYELRLRTWKQTEPSSAPQTWAGWQSPNRADCELREIRGGGKEGDEEDVRRDGEMCWSGSGLAERVNRVEERREFMEKMFQSGMNAKQIP